MGTYGLSVLIGIQTKDQIWQKEVGSKGCRPPSKRWRKEKRIRIHRRTRKVNAARHDAKQKLQVEKVNKIRLGKIMKPGRKLMAKFAVDQHILGLGLRTSPKPVLYHRLNPGHHHLKKFYYDFHHVCLTKGRIDREDAFRKEKRQKRLKKALAKAKTEVKGPKVNSKKLKKLQIKKHKAAMLEKYGPGKEKKPKKHIRLALIKKVKRVYNELVEARRPLLVKTTNMRTAPKRVNKGPSKGKRAYYKKARAARKELMKKSKESRKAIKKAQKVRRRERTMKCIPLIRTLRRKLKEVRAQQNIIAREIIQQSMRKDNVFRKLRRMEDRSKPGIVPPKVRKSIRKAKKHHRRKHVVKKTKKSTKSAKAPKAAAAKATAAQ